MLDETVAFLIFTLLIPDIPLRGKGEAPPEAAGGEAAAAPAGLAH